jgi:hypothetical protein
MARWAKTLPEWTNKYKTEHSISAADAIQLRTEMGKIGDQYLATIYAELPTHARMSILADAIETEMIDRFVGEHLMVPELVLEDDESVAVGAI